MGNRALSHIANCETKKQYHSWHAAKRAARLMHFHTGSHVEPYRCAACGKVHLGGC